MSRCFRFLLSPLMAAWALTLHGMPTTPTSPSACLFTYFTGNGEDGLHLAWSRDGYHWRPLNQGRSFLRPEVGESKLMRDPCLARGPDGTFHLVWTTSWQGRTIGHASSRDLIHWSGQQAIPVMAQEPAARNCWAPELAWDAKRERWLILWATTIPGRFPATESQGDDAYNHRIYATTTRDFLTFTPTRLFLDPGFNVIDATLLHDRGRYYLIVKDETRHPVRKHLRWAVSDDIEGPFQDFSPPFTRDWVEGPSALRLGEEVLVYFDAYRDHHYGAVRTRDWRHWEEVSQQMRFPQGMRHGTVLAVPADILTALLAHDEANAPAAAPTRPHTVKQPAVPRPAPRPARPETPALRSTLPAWAFERLGRGLVAIREDDRSVFLSWRLLRTDPADVAFAVQRRMGDQPPVRLNAQPLSGGTWFRDTNAPASAKLEYTVEPVVGSGVDGPTGRAVVPAHTPRRPYLRIPLRTPEGYAPNDGSVGDLDGDGEYELVLHQAGRGRDNSQAGYTDPPVLQAYKLDGSLLWTIRLGRNLREGAHYVPFIVYDLDGDGRAEVACRTADGTRDGVGHPIGDPAADWRSHSGRTLGKVLRGPEYLTIFDGRTGAALASAPYLPPRHPGTNDPTPEQMRAVWGDDYGNRMDRFLACVAYLDGQRPSLVMCRGYYTRTVLVAWNWRKGGLSHLWTFDSDDGRPGNRAYRGQGNHNLAVADVDADGRDEIIYGACAIDDDGRGLYSTGLGHGDALHVSDLDPDRPGLEVLDIHERPSHPHAMEMHDAATGQILWSRPSPDVGRGLAADIDPRHRGCECWAAGRGLDGLFDCRGRLISARKPRSCNFALWWDGDPLRELLDHNRISKWDWQHETETVLLEDPDCTANNGTKATPVLCADLVGDWREEVLWRTRDNQELRLYVSAIPTPARRVTLMHDRQYRLSVAWQNVGYNQPTQPRAGTSFAAREVGKGDRAAMAEDGWRSTARPQRTSR